MRAPHPAQARGQHHAPLERPTEPLRRQLPQRLARALEDPLASDVDPGPRRHLPVHRQAGRLQLPEGLPVGPLGNEHRVRDEHAWSRGLRPEHADRLAGLDEQRLVALEPPKGPDDLVEGVPASGGLARAAVHDEILRPFGHVGVEVVHQHAKRGLLGPCLARQIGAARRADLGNGRDAHVCNSLKSANTWSG